MAGDDDKRQGGASSGFLGALKAAVPIMLGYIVLGLPAGILCARAGMSVLQTFILVTLMYSGAGQYMIANMLLAGSAIGSIVASVALVNARQMLYASSMARYFKGVNRGLCALFAATVTDESFGVNLLNLESGRFGAWQAIAVNLLSFSCWIAAVVTGSVIGTSVAIPTAIASFAMTAIFICLLASQGFDASKVAAALASAACVLALKVAGASGFAIFIGAITGMAAGLLVSKATGRGDAAGHDASAVEDADGGGEGR